MPVSTRIAAESPQGAVLAACCPTVEASTTTPAENRALGTLIRSWRRRQRLSQVALATRLNIPRVALSKIETGQQVVPAALFLRIALICQVPVEALFDGPLAPRDAFYARWRTLTEGQRTALAITIDAFSDGPRPAPLPLTPGATALTNDDCGCCPPRP